MTAQNPSIPALHARILVVDDHPMTAQTLSRTLMQLGPEIEVISATSGKGALEKVKDGAVDLVITDLMMPEMNGLELIEQLRSHPGGQPTYTILVTAYDVPGLRESARRLKVNETIIKPIRPEHLCQVVSRALCNMSASRPPKSSTDGQGSAFKILIADDVQDNLSLLGRFLQSEGYAYVTAADGLEALQKIRSEMPDLILLDVNMPKMDGFQVLEALRSDAAVKHIPVIILTAARIGYADLHAGLNLGADDYVTKPFDRRELLARIRTRLRVKAAEDGLRQRNRELSLLPEIGRELSARTNLFELMDVVLRRTVDALGAMSGHLFVINSKVPLHKEYYRPVTESNEHPVQVPPLNHFLDQIKDYREGLILPDVREDERWDVLPDDPTRSVIMIPMFGRSDVIGLLMLHHERAGYFTEEHQLLLTAIAGQAAIAVENTQLYSRVSAEQQKLLAVLQNADDAILMFDENECLSLLNSAAEKLFTDVETRIGVPLLRGRGYDPLLQLIDETYTSSAPKTGEVLWNDQRFFSAFVTPIAEGGCVVVLHDISHFKALDRIKNEFISTASHDLKNPIATILGFSQIISQAGSLNDLQLDFANRIHNAAINMDKLVQDLLALAKMDANLELKREAVDLNSVVTEIVNEFAPQFQAKEQIFALHESGNRVNVQADMFQLKQVLRNLIGNAIKYTPTDGSISLSLEIDQQNAIVSIRDTGYGIPEEDLPHIFDRFFRVRHDSVKDIEGNGLGLAIVKAIIEKHGGQIRVESELGEGSCFTIGLPLMQVPLPLVAINNGAPLQVKEELNPSTPPTHETLSVNQR